MTYSTDRFQQAWEGFAPGDWKTTVNLRDFIQRNYTPYQGDESFLVGPTVATLSLWEQVMVGIKTENATHAPVDFDTDKVSTIDSHDAGYIDQNLEQIVNPAF